MSDLSAPGANLPTEQQAIRARCFHPTGKFVEFREEDIEQSIPERFEKIVRQYPDRIAVKAASHAVTYAELNAMANRLARLIVNQRGSAAEPVALFFDKGIPLVAAMLAVLKAGKFFVLLDPLFPKKRLAALVEDALAALVVTGQQNASLTQQVVPNGCSLIRFESIDHSLPAKDVSLNISPEAHAFILYTSGSAGERKGVVQTHRNVLHNVMLRTNAYHVCDHDRLSLLASGTPNAVINMFLALLNGAALLSFDVQKDGLTELSSWFLQERVSFCWVSSPLFRSFCKTLTGREGFPDLRFIGLASDTVHKTDVDLYKRYFSPNCSLAINLTGTETGLLRTYLIDRETDICGDEVPVGYPVDGKQILLLDETGKEVGFNEIGEIVVRSRYLSPGYWQRSDLTEAKFKPDPKGGDERLYFTGDLGLMLADGCLTHKGRKDFRVKIRGYAVEIAEVEKALRAHPAINDAVVVAHGNEVGELRLVVYFTSRSQPKPSVSELRGFLKTRLPDYMVPSTFVTLVGLPLPPNGKVDRRRLPQPNNSRPELEIPFVAPRSTVEDQLAQIWAQTLSLDQVGVQDNFFDLGGHSLAATRIVSQVIKHFQVDLPLKSLFESPTVAEMAIVITEHQEKKLGTEELHRILTELESLSDEEAQRLVANRSTAGRP